MTLPLISSSLRAAAGSGAFSLVSSNLCVRAAGEPLAQSSGRFLSAERARR
eukprot:CAMPEP_0195099644 /NCGR_PEP_ID=MMETSP0448-20130528/58744_1 /TAXON_ID=66468 /ORGANISM="Heterocapsa triquestra, Strain CCMP 448" /LENGTH=50 /DNA_ID=CAMNT_0040134577 /DNA_START=211 /DNA_END=361 /DNA_ORIENTATION=+